MIDFEKLNMLAGLIKEIDALIQKEMEHYAKHCAEIEEEANELSAYVQHMKEKIKRQKNCDHLFVLLADNPECIKCGKSYVDECNDRENALLKERKHSSCCAVHAGSEEECKD